MGRKRKHKTAVCSPKGCLEPRMRFIVFDRSTGLYLSSRLGADGWDMKPCRFALSRRNEASLFWSKDAAESAVRSVSSEYGCGLHEWKVVGEHEECPPRTDCSKVRFPRSLSAEDLKGFIPTRNGWTKPMVGRINGEGPLFIVKFASHTSEGHVRNEHLTHGIYRGCGLNAPRSRLYRLKSRDGGGELVLLSEYIEGKPLCDCLLGATDDGRRMIAREILRSFPLDSFLCNYDSYNNDNALLDADGRLWHIDNGSSMRFRATGGMMPWTANRTDPSDARNGAYCLLTGDCRYKSPHLHQALDCIPKEEVEGSWGAFGMKFVAVVRKLIPAGYRSPGLYGYARRLDSAIANGEGRIPMPASRMDGMAYCECEWRLKDDEYNPKSIWE